MYRTIRLAGVSATGQQDAVAAVLFHKTKGVPEGYRKLDKQAGGSLNQAIKRAECSLKRGGLTCLYPGGSVSRLYVLGLGDRDKFDAEAIRIAAAKLSRAVHTAQVKRLDLQLLAGLGNKAAPDVAGRAAAEGITLANFDFDEFKGTVTNNAAKGKSKTLTLSVKVDRAARKGFATGLIVGEGANIARQLGATPPNVCNPAYLVRYCRKLVRGSGLRCTVIDRKKAAELKMGGLLAVGQAGSTPPAMICLEWKGPRTKSKPRQPILLVGKAITFDTGGYSLKINNSMLGMKYDKCGGMAVIGAMHAIAKLKLPVHVVALVAAAENMVDTKAYRPNDIITMTNGVTVEVTNTDAEGRLVLADALAYGCKRYKPVAVIDLATLTGGVVVALGNICAGLFCNDAKLRRHLFDAADDTAERLWHLPLWDEHRDLMKGTHSDIVNSSGQGRGAHPIQGAAFLSYFATANGDPAKHDTVPWAHIDIAGVADTKSETALYRAGPTGYGARLITRAIETWK